MPTGDQTAGQETARPDLKSWWKGFKDRTKTKEDKRGEHGAYGQHQPPNQAGADPTDGQGIFGVPLATSVRYANVAISLNDANGQSYIYGYVPIVVAKCGVFLKEKATDVEGIFRLSGSEKRIKELRNTFNSPDRYGKGLDWTGYTVHDAANILRRYFNQLPEPIIPLEFYDRFRDPLRHHQSQAVGPMDGQSPSVGDFNHDDAIKTYQQIITQLPPLNRQLLLYILDLLAVFASKSDLNKMTTPNLAAIFQPGILSHPAHDMSPPEYRLSQDVLIFLIENQDHFLIGMQGTAADERTVQEVESGPPTPSHKPSTPRHSKSTVVRSGSNSSRYSGVRRSVSASSRKSRSSAVVAAAPSPVGSDFHTPLASPPQSATVHRSNTLPPTRSPNLTQTRFGRDKESAQPTPEPIKEKVEPVKNLDTARPPAKLHSQPIMQEMMTPTEDNMPPPVPESLLVESTKPQGPIPQPKSLNREGPGNLELPSNTLQVPGADQTTPTGGAKIVQTLFGNKSPPAEGARRPNKLQKKRAGGSANPSAHSSTHSLNDGSEIDPSQRSIQNSLASNAPLLSPRRDNIQGALWEDDGGPLKTPPPIGGGHPNMSPAASYASHSDIEGTDPEHFNLQGDENASEQGRRRHWFSRDRKAESTQQTTVATLGSNGLAQASRSSVLSGSEAGNRKSVNLDRGYESVTSDGERKEKNPLSWIKGKVRDLHDKLEDRDRRDKRMTSPSRVPAEQSPSNIALTDPQSIDSVAAGTISPPRKQSTEQQLMPPPPVRTSISSRDSSARGKSIDIPRQQVSSPAPARQSHDVSRTLPTSLQVAHPPANRQSIQQPPAQTVPVTIPPSDVISEKT